jgi:hypothetical protein
MVNVDTGRNTNSEHRIDEQHFLTLGVNYTRCNGECTDLCWSCQSRTMSDTRSCAQLGGRAGGVRARTHMRAHY